MAVPVLFDWTLHRATGMQNKNGSREAAKNAKRSCLGHGTLILKCCELKPSLRLDGPSWRPSRLRANPFNAAVSATQFNQAGLAQ